MDELTPLSFPEAQVRAFFYELLRSPSTMLRKIADEDEDEMSALLDGCMLGLSLHVMGTGDGRSDEKKWEMISKVWVEMLMYAATHCGWKEHADALARGGELLTHVYLLMAHLGLCKQCPPELSSQVEARFERLDGILDALKLFASTSSEILVRFRSLSNPICSLIDGREFINLHLNHSITTKSNHSIILKEWDLFSVDFDALSDAVGTKHHPLYSGGGTEVIGSVNGLVFLRRSETNIAVYNLSTRECKKCYVAEIEIPRGDLRTG
uniref:Uncharacterized protein n=1 Tax=Salix viminalis TaxID=40686 RepID=A0A6N2KCJ3_SALVM